MTRLVIPLLLALGLAACLKSEPQAETPPLPGATGDAGSSEPAPAEPTTADGAAEGDAAPWRSFGSDFEGGDVVQASRFLADPEAFAGKTLVLEGTVADVCQMAGCWLVIADGTNSIRVRTRDHGFSIDKDCSGDTARIHGRVVVKDITPAEASHFASESKRPELAPESGKAEKRYEIEATGVKLKRS